MTAPPPAPIAVPERALLGQGHVRTTGQQHRCHRRHENEPFHRTLRLVEVSAGQGNFCVKYTNTPSIDGISSRAGC
jgi:hypothetical protein